MWGKVNSTQIWRPLYYKTLRILIFGLDLNSFWAIVKCKQRSNIPEFNFYPFLLWVLYIFVDPVFICFSVHHHQWKKRKVSQKLFRNARGNIQQTEEDSTLAQFFMPSGKFKSLWDLKIVEFNFIHEILTVIFLILHSSD